MKFTRDKHLHSKEHVLADELSKKMGESKRFASYLGIAKLYEESDLRALLRYITEKRDLPVEARGKYFFASIRRLNQKRGAELKNAIKKSKMLKNARNSKRTK